MMKIYTDQNLKIEIENNIIFENGLYYIDFGNLKAETIKIEIEKSKLKSFVNWHYKNKIGTLKIVNFVGFIKLFGETYDVRSNKFFEGMEGKNQFEHLLNDLIELSKDVIFSYASPTMAVREIDRFNINPSLLMRFNYYKQIILDWPVGYNLPSLFEKLLKNPHAVQFSEYNLDHSWKAKKFNHRFIRSIVNSDKHYSQIDKNSPLSNSKISQFISKNHSVQFFPTKAEISVNRLSFDTSENRFIKFFFKEIESVCLEVGRIRNLPKYLFDDKEKMLTFVRNMLRNEIFLQVGNIIAMPDSSSVLLNRPGYREIYSHYIYSKFGVIHIFEDIDRQSLYIDLKDIATLYEYWVFYKLAIAFLGKKIIIEQKRASIKDGVIRNSVVFKNDGCSVSYNVTFSKSRGDCYSLSLRPDIFVRIEGIDKTFNFLFDAKYKVAWKEFIEQGEESFIERTFKREDLYKMHCYLDAIVDSICSVAIYPGTEFRFYEKDLTQPFRKNPLQVEKCEGVGAVPLIPGFKEGDKVFYDFIECVKNYANG